MRPFYKVSLPLTNSPPPPPTDPATAPVKLVLPTPLQDLDTRDPRMYNFTPPLASGTRIIKP